MFVLSKTKRCASKIKVVSFKFQIKLQLERKKSKNDVDEGCGELDEYYILALSKFKTRDFRELIVFEVSTLELNVIF